MYVCICVCIKIIYIYIYIYKHVDLSIAYLVPGAMGDTRNTSEDRTAKVMEIINYQS